MPRWPSNPAYRRLARDLTVRRRALGMSQWDLDQALGISFGYTAKLEIGMRIATGPLLLDWAATLGIPLIASPDTPRPPASQPTPQALPRTARARPAPRATAP